MTPLIAAIITAATAENIVLAKMLGLCPFINLSKHRRLAAGIGAATTAVLTAACAIAWGINALLPAALRALQPLLFIAVIAALVSAAEGLMRLKTPALHRALGVFLPLIATNCAVLGVILLTLGTHATQQPQAQAGQGGLIQATAAGFGGGLGFTLAVIALALINERIVTAQVPKPFRGAPLAILSAGIMALALSAL